MKAVIQDLKDSFKIGYEAYERSRKEANMIWDLYHNRQFTDEQMAILANRGQPAETFNIIKAFARMLVGYYSTIVNTVVVNPTNPRDIDTAAALNDVIESIFEDNRFDIEGDTIKLAGMISGLLCSYTNVVHTGEYDSFNRPINKVIAHHIRDAELVLDPASVKDDYSDARFLHRFRWMTDDAVRKVFGADAFKDLDSHYNFLNIDEAEFTFNYGEPFTGYYKVFDNYLIVHTVMEDEEGKRWSIFWSGEHILLKEEITLKETRWPYRIQKLHASDKTEYYGIFREVRESQHALNQAVIKIQLLVNTDKAYVEDGAVENINDFTDAYNRVNAVIPVTDFSKIHIDKMSVEIQNQYIIIDRSLDRIQRVLGINDSFLGMAFASDSGRKVKLQQNATIMSLRYITARIESFYRSLGMDIANLVKQYYRANQIIMVTDEIVGARWLEINQPMLEATGQFEPDGTPIMQPILLPMNDPASGEIMEDDEGNIILAPISEEGTEFSFLGFQIRIDPNSYNDEDEKAQLLLETVLSGQVGQMMMQVNPAGYLKMSALSIKSMKTKYSPDIVKVIEQTAQKLEQDPAANEQAALNAQGGGQQPKSKTLKLPQNTNEGV